MEGVLLAAISKIEGMVTTCDINSIENDAHRPYTCRSNIYTTITSKLVKNYSPKLPYSWEMWENKWRGVQFSRVAIYWNYRRSIHAMAILLSQWPTPQGIKAVVIETSTSTDQSNTRSFQVKKSVMRYDIAMTSHACNYENGGNFEFSICLQG